MDSQNISTIDRLLDRNLEALNRRDIEAVLANQRSNARLLVGGQFAIEGHEQLASYTEALWAAFPDGDFRHEDRIITDDAAAVELVFTGTHIGPLTTPAGEIPATGRRVILRSASLMHLRGGLIAVEHAYSDQLHFMTQLGLLPGAST
jgi:predicted ester cyclase